MITTNDWLANMLDSLEDGEYWHIPADNTLLKINKNKRKLSLISGEVNSTIVERLSRHLPALGYTLAIEKSDYFIP
jgi:hypothetical protein